MITRVVESRVLMVYDFDDVVVVSDRKSEDDGNRKDRPYSGTTRHGVVVSSAEEACWNTIQRRDSTDSM